jgi:hypothetical protein
MRKTPIQPRLLLPLGLWAGLAAMDAAVWSRRLSGALPLALPAAVAWISTAMVAAAALVALVSWRQVRPRSTRVEWQPAAITLVLPVLWGIVAGWGTAPFTQGGLWALGGLLIMGIGLGSIGEAASNSPEPETRAQMEENSNHWQRRLVVDGTEIIEGGARIQFAPGQKETVLHLAFCPPLAAPPTIHAENGLGDDLEFRTEAVHTFGARLSIRRSSGADAEERDIEYAAVPGDG